MTVEKDAEIVKAVAAEREEPLPMCRAPKDATWVCLLIDYSTHDATCQMEDQSSPQWTIGFNNDDNTGESEGWKFVGWDWQHDCIVGTCAGTPIGWLPFRPTAIRARGERDE